MMPEGPEVRVMWRDLRKYYHGGRIEEINILTGGDKFTLPERVKGRVIEDVAVHGKALFFCLDDGSAIYSSLGMTGGWRRGEESPRFTLLTMVTSRGLLHYADARKFGRLCWYADREEKLRTLGLDPFSPAWNEADFGEVARGHPRCNITSFLMNQHYIAGIGNYLKAEILYRTALSPLRKMGSLSSQELGRLFTAIGAIMEESYQAGGYSLRDYFHLDGSAGRFRPVIYHQRTDPQGRDIVRHKTPDGRITHWCPAAQH